MKVSTKLQNKLRQHSKIFQLAWLISKQKGVSFNVALHEAWIIAKNKALILPYLTTTTRASRIEHSACQRTLSIQF